MTRRVRGRAMLGRLTVVLAVVAVLGHICALPHDAHAATAETSDAHGHHDGHSSDGALHAASCEAVPPNAALVAPPLPITGSVTVREAAAPVHGEILVSRPPAVDTSPPLFLLHSALRI